MPPIVMRVSSRSAYFRATAAAVERLPRKEAGKALVCRRPLDADRVETGIDAVPARSKAPVEITGCRDEAAMLLAGKQHRSKDACCEDKKTNRAAVRERLPGATGAARFVLR